MRIAISGAGIAGPTLAYWLHLRGHEPVLIERAPRLRTGGYIVDFWGVGYTVAEQMGIMAQVQEAGYVVRAVRLVDGDGRTVGGFSGDVFRRLTGTRFTSLPRGDLAAAIFATIQDRVEVRFGDGISAIDEHAAGVRVAFDRGGEGDFDLVVGADGLHSAVRALAFGPALRFERQLGFHVAAFEVEGYRPREELLYVSHTRPGRQVAKFALRGDRTLVLFVFADPGDQDTGARAGRKATLQRVFGDVGWECPEMLRAMEAVEDLYFDRVSQVRMPSWSRGRVALIGDAASCVSLLAGEGAGIAMAEAYVLAGELARAAGDYREAFRRHEQRLRPFVEAKQRSARYFAAAFAPKTRAGVWFRNRASRLLAIPPVADVLLGRDLRDDFDLPDYGR